MKDAVLNRVLSSGKLRVGVNPGFEPFSYLLNTKRCTGKPTMARVGIDIDIAELLAKGLLVDPVIVVPKAFDQLIPMLQAGEIDIAIAAMSRVFERALRVDFSDAYYHTGFSILLNLPKGYRIGIGEAKTYGDLKAGIEAVNKENKLIVAVTRGKSAAGFVSTYFQLARILKYDSNEMAARAVLSPEDETPHLMVHDEIFLHLWHGRLSRRQQQRLVVFPKPFRSDSYGFAVAKGNLDFLQVLNLFISDKLMAEERMIAFKQRHHHCYIPGIGVKAMAPEEGAHDRH